MSGVHGQILGHLVRRSAEYMSASPAAQGNQDAYVQSLEQNALLYEDSPFKDVKPYEIAIVGSTFAVFMIAYALVKYTLGEVVASLAMIEQPTALVVAEYRSVKDDTDTDAPHEKDGLLDEEVIIMKDKPITSSIRGTIRHIASVGGYTARWRGIKISAVYHAMQALLAHLLAMLFSTLPVFSPFAFVISSILSTVLLARIHMTWTHIMISSPSALPWYRRIPSGRTYIRALAMPAFIFAIAQHLTVILPLMVYFSFDSLPDPSSAPLTSADHNKEGLRFILTLATAAFVALALLLPASVTLTRVEASLLPDDTETIVNFDRTLGGAAANLVGFGKINFRALYDSAWRSFDKASRIRLIKFYVKYFGIMTALWLSFAGLIGAEIVYFGGERLMVFMHSAGAQIQLASMQANAQ